MNIIIVGCGRVGRSIAEQLSKEGHDITAIDVNPKELEKIYDTENVMMIEGNGASLPLLQEAGIGSCDLLIAVTAADELNLYTCLLAKNSGVNSTIARVRNPQYISDVNVIKDDLKLTMAINPEFTCASEIARLVKYVGIKSIRSFAGGQVDMIKIIIDDKSLLADKRIADCSSLLKGGVRFCFVERGDDLYIPDGEFVLQVGDEVSFVAPSSAASKLLKSLGVISNRARRAMILGGSKIGFYLAQILRDAGLSVKIFENNPERCEELSEELHNVMIINGDAMDEDLLISEGIQHADAVICLMDTDEENLLASLYAKQMNPGAKVVTELGNLKFRSVVNALPLDSIIRPKHLTGQYIIRYVRGMQNTIGNKVETMYKISHDRAEALEFLVREDSALTGVPLAKLNLKNDLQIICISRNGEIIIPGGNDTIEKGDSVIVVTKHTGLTDLKSILK